MSGSEDPWGSPPPPRRPGRPIGLLLWLVLLAAAAAGALWLAFARPAQMQASEDVARLVYLLVLFAAVSSGLIYVRRLDLGRLAHDLALWGAIVMVLALGYTFRDEIRHVGARVLAELMPGQAISSGAAETVLVAGQDGHFHIVGEVNGAPVRFLIDTGASDIVLGPEDARRAGLDPRSLNFSRVTETANGLGRAAPVTLESLRIGPRRLTGKRASVNQAEMRTSLLGMAFLRDVAALEIRGSTLFIRWH